MISSFYARRSSPKTLQKSKQTFKYLWMSGAAPVRLPAPRSLGGAPLPVSITWSCRVILNGSSVACEITAQRYKKSWNIPFSIYSTYRTTKNLEKDETKKWEIEWKKKKREREREKKKRKNEACSAPEIRRIFYVSALAGISVNLTGLHTTILEDRVIAACSRYQCLR